MESTHAARKLQLRSQEINLSHLHVHNAALRRPLRATAHLLYLCRSWAWTCPRGLKMRRGRPNRAWLRWAALGGAPTLFM